MNGWDVTALTVIAVAALFGFLMGFGKILRTLTGGIVGTLICGFLCATFGGMIAGIPAVAELLTNLNAKIGEKVSFLATMHIETVIFYAVLFGVLQILRKILVGSIASIFEVNVAPVRVVNKVLGAVLNVAAVILLVFLVFGIFRAMEGTSFVQSFLQKIEGTYVELFYEINPVNFNVAVPEIPEIPTIPEIPGGEGVPTIPTTI